MGFEPGLKTSLVVMLKTPASSRVLELEASVMWTREREETSPSGAGVQFSNVDSSDMDILKGYVQSTLENDNN